MKGETRTAALAPWRRPSHNLRTHRPRQHPQRAVQGAHNRWPEPLPRFVQLRQETGLEPDANYQRSSDLDS